MQASAAVACMWSGVAMTTASMFFASLSSILRKSVYFAALSHVETPAPTGRIHIGQGHDVLGRRAVPQVAIALPADADAGHVQFLVGRAGRENVRQGEDGAGGCRGGLEKATTRRAHNSPLSRLEFGSSVLWFFSSATWPLVYEYQIANTILRCDYRLTPMVPGQEWRLASQTDVPSAAHQAEARYAMAMELNKRVSILLIALTWTCVASAQVPTPTQGDFVIQDFRFASGETLPELRLHYRTLGKPQRDAQGRRPQRRARSCTAPAAAARSIWVRVLPASCFGQGGLLDAERFFLILPDSIGHGQSSKPSDGLQARFPRYGYVDMVEAQYRLVTEGLGVNHLRLVMGASMGGMHTWLWGERYPGFHGRADAAGQPADADFRPQPRLASRRDRRHPQRSQPGGAATTKRSRRACAPPRRCCSSWAAIPCCGSGRCRTLAASDAALDAAVDQHRCKTSDANDLLYQLEASRDYDPGPGPREDSRARSLAVNSADDLINPPELGILEREIKRVPHGKAIVLPTSDQTRGHGTHTIAAVWKHLLEELLATSAR